MLEAKLFRPRNCWYGLIGDYPWTLRKALSKIYEISVRLQGDTDVFMIDASPKKAKNVLTHLGNVYQDISKKEGIKAPKLAYEFWNY